MTGLLGQAPIRSAGVTAEGPWRPSETSRSTVTVSWGRAAPVGEPCTTQGLGGSAQRRLGVALAARRLCWALWRLASQLSGPTAAVWPASGTSSQLTAAITVSGRGSSQPPVLAGAIGGVLGAVGVGEQPQVGEEPPEPGVRRTLEQHWPPNRDWSSWRAWPPRAWAATAAVGQPASDVPGWDRAGLGRPGRDWLAGDRHSQPGARPRTGARWRSTLAAVVAWRRRWRRPRRATAVTSWKHDGGCSRIVRSVAASARRTRTRSARAAVGQPGRRRWAAAATVVAAPVPPAGRPAHYADGLDAKAAPFRVRLGGQAPSGSDVGPLLCLEQRPG